MYLSNFQRVVKVSRNLALNPNLILNYISYSITSKSPFDLELPWWSWKAIKSLEKHLTKEHKVFEWGTGGSTLYLAKHAKSVTSVEQHPEWLKKLKDALNSRGIENVDLLEKDLDASSQDNFLSCSYAEALNSKQDVIVIDGEDHFGPHSEWSARELCFQLAEKWIQTPGGIIVVDDSWRYPIIREKSKASKIVIHESVGPCRKGVTSTDFHYY